MLRTGAAERFGLSLLLVGVAAVWGWTFVVVHNAVAVYGVLAFLAVRFAIATVTLAPFSARKLDRRTLKIGIALGLVLASVYFFQTLGLRYTSASNSGLITGLFVVLVPFVDRIFFGIRTRWYLWAAIAVSLAGMAMLMGQSPKAFRTGDALTLVAAAGCAVQISLLSRYSRGHDSGALAMGQMLTVAVVFAIAWPCFEPLELPTPEVWRALLITGIFASALAFTVQAYAQRRLPAVRAGVIFALEPLFAVIFGFLLAGDRLRPLQIVGAACLLVAVTVAEMVPRMERKGPSSRPGEVDLSGRKR